MAFNAQPGAMAGALCPPGIWPCYCHYKNPSTPSWFRPCDAEVDYFQRDGGRFWPMADKVLEDVLLRAWLLQTDHPEAALGWALWRLGKHGLYLKPATILQLSPDTVARLRQEYARQEYTRQEALRSELQHSTVQVARQSEELTVLESLD